MEIEEIKEYSEMNEVQKFLENTCLNDFNELINKKTTAEFVDIKNITATIVTYPFINEEWEESIKKTIEEELGKILKIIPMIDGSQVVLCKKKEYK